MNTISYVGISPGRLADLLTSGTDDNGAPVVPFVDTEGGWPLRCCLRDSIPGDELAIVGYTPSQRIGPYSETGPVVVHVARCPGAAAGFPADFDDRDQVMRPFGDDAGRVNTQVYSLHRLVRAGDGLQDAIEVALTDPRVHEVHVHNVVSQCFSFAAMVTPDSTSS